MKAICSRRGMLCHKTQFSRLLHAALLHIADLLSLHCLVAEKGFLRGFPCQKDTFFKSQTCPILAVQSRRLKSLACMSCRCDSTNGWLEKQLDGRTVGWLIGWIYINGWMD